MTETVERRLIIGISVLITGIVLLVIGFLIFIDLSSLNALAYIGNVHRYATLRILAFLSLGWGIALLISGILIFFLQYIKYTFKTKKIFAVVIGILVVGLAVTGIFGAAAIPPKLHINVVPSINSHYVEIYPSSNTDIYGNFSVSVNYPYLFYLNITVNSTTSDIFSGGCGYSTSIPFAFYNFYTAGNHTITLTIISHGVKKIFSTWVYVFPQSKASFTGILEN